MSLTAEEKTARRIAKPLVDKLASMKENWPSEPSLRHLSPSMIDALITYIKTDVKVFASIRWMFLMPVLFLLLFAFTGSSAINIVAALYSVGLCVCFAFSNKNMPQPAVHALTQTEDIRVLPVLILESRHSGAQNLYVYNAIFRLLGQVTEEHADLLNNDVQQHLWTIMMMRFIVTEYSDRELTLRTLRALAMVGNNATLARVVRLVYSYKYNGSERYLIDEARKLIPMMEARLERQHVPETLLRAADVPTSAPDMLLRPTFAAPMEPTEQLLRASGPKGE